MTPDLYSFRNSLIIVALAALLGLGATASGQSAPRTAAKWEYISYPRMEIPTAKGETCTVLVGFGDIKPDLRFDVLWSGRDSVKPPDAIMKPDRTSVRLHLPDGTIVEPKNKQEGSPPASGGAGGVTVSRMFFFPWGPNKLDEAWFEFRIDNRTYWIELPYGFSRDPSAPLAPAEPNAAPPALAPAMKKIPPEDRIVPWTKIDYDLGPIQNGWRLSFELSNPSDPQCMVTLYSEKMFREGKQWELDKPKTSAKVIEDGGGEVRARQIGARVPDPFRRVDEYSFFRWPNEGRDWGTLTITVDGKPKTAVIPSSLFKYLHGVAEPSHPQRIRAEVPR